jgi:hypothetical protein
MISTSPANISGAKFSMLIALSPFVVRSARA